MKTFTTIALAIAFSGALFAQTATSAADPKLNIHQRKENQQDRIAQGVKSGQLTAGETSNLEKKESKLNKEEKDMREDDHGKLTKADRRKLNRQQNRLSRRIYKDKHNGRKQ